MRRVCRPRTRRRELVRLQRCRQTRLPWPTSGEPTRTRCGGSAQVRSSPADLRSFLPGVADLQETPCRLQARRVTIVEDERAASEPRGVMNQIDRTMTAGDV